MEALASTGCLRLDVCCCYFFFKKSYFEGLAVLRTTLLDCLFADLLEVILPRCSTGIR
jgi:hypothetical protein